MSDIIARLHHEADLCSNKGVPETSALLEDAIQEIVRLRALLRRVQACGLNEQPPGCGFTPSKQERIAGQLSADIGAALAEGKS